MEKLNITPLLDRFRLASRELYNNHFMFPSPQELGAWDWRENFDFAENALFKAMVIYPSPLSPAEYGPKNSQILVSPNTDTTPAFINREYGKSHGYWDCPITEIDRTATLYFACFFDFDIERQMDNQYALTWIEQWPKNEGLIGRYALIEHQYLSYYFDIDGLT
ncbi:hypothetical protein FEV53_19190 [Palleronia caenipelagi]|uniref:Uncharacterized protein n=2 Tax=Palleronia caenipelagi TaxID=2489174 RepID=A0A547PIJ9_9RHOB|nr:hypothetical protein FEV53_19780 [Palleronia caenipelagi]TRD14312.1 hypothetical protein FEV53_19190 [Palleronia caenipelagi]